MLETDRTLKTEIDLYYDLLLPDELTRPAPLLIAVHGYGAHKRYMMREARAVAPEGWAIASIQAPHQHFRKTDDGYRVGFGWLTDHRPEEYVTLHHQFILRIIELLAGDDCVDPSRVFLYGFSQAVALNFRFAFSNPDVLAGIVAVCGGVPGDLETNEKYRTCKAPTLYLYSDDDEFYSEEQYKSHVSRLEKMLPNLTAKQYNAKHEITEEMRSDTREFLKQ
jgi:predicted esterase